MIRITIFQNRTQEISGFCCKGHAGYADSGSDIICAAVSVLVINTVNALDRFSDTEFSLETEEDTGKIELHFTKTADHDAKLLVETMILGLQGIQKDYGTKYLTIYFKEV